MIVCHQNKKIVIQLCVVEPSGKRVSCVDRFFVQIMNTASSLDPGPGREGNSIHNSLHLCLYNMASSEIKHIQIVKEEMKLSLFVNELFLYQKIVRNILQTQTY